MVTRTNKSLEKINKRDIVNITLSLQSKLDKANKDVVEEIRKLSDAILKLRLPLNYFEIELAVSQQENPHLSNRFTSIKCQY